MNRHDIVFINPAAYRGTMRRGPYELAGLDDMVKSAGFDSVMLDLQRAVAVGSLGFPARHLAGVEALLAEHQARIYFLTLRTTGGPWAVEIARRLRSRDPAGWIVFHGPRIERRLFDFARRDAVVDVGCLDRAEDLILDLVSCLVTTPASPARTLPASVDDVPGIFYRREGTLHRSNALPRRRGEHPTGRPWISPDGTVAAVHVGRGCPRRCTFCSAPLHSGSVPRYIPAAAVVEDAQAAWERLDPETRSFVMLETENLLSSPDMVGEIVSERRLRQATFQWGAYGRIDDIDAELMDRLEHGGCRFLFFGVETGAPGMLRVLGKPYDLSIVVPTISRLRARGILTLSSFLFGLPGETWNDVVATAELMAEVVWAGGQVDWTPLRVEADSAMERMVPADTLQLLPHSELYLDLCEAGVVPEKVDPVIGYRMYGVPVAYPLDAMCLTARAWRAALLTAPATLYGLIHGLGADVRGLLEVVGTTSRDDVGPILAEWVDARASHDADAHRFLRALLRSELAGADLGTRTSPSSDFVRETLRRHPALLPTIFHLPWWRGGLPTDKRRVQPCPGVHE